MRTSASQIDLDAASCVAQYVGMKTKDVSGSEYARLANQRHYDSCPKCHSDEDGYCDDGVRLAEEYARVATFEEQEFKPRSCQESMDWHVLECPICFYAGQPTCETGVRLDKMAKEELICFPEPTDDPFGEH